jgi:hypothetical protein
MTQGAADGWKVIGLFPSPYVGLFFYDFGTFQFSAKKGDHELFDFRTRKQFGRQLEIYDSKSNLIGSVSNDNITVGELKIQIDSNKHLAIFSFKGENYFASKSKGAITLSRTRDGLVLAKFRELVYYGAKNGLGDILIRTEAFSSNLHLAIIPLIVWQIYARFHTHRARAINDGIIVGIGLF